MTDRLAGGPLHVVHVVHSLDTGGMEKGVVTLASRTVPAIRHTIVCLTRAGAFARRLPAGTAVIEMHKRPGNSPVFLWRLSRRLASLRPDVVHTRNWPGIDGILAARLAGLRRLVHGEHGWGMDDPQGLDPRRIRTRRFSSRWVREIVCVSETMRRWLTGTVAARCPVTQIYNGVDTERYRPATDRAALRAALGLAREAFAVGIVGRLDPIKDHSTLFRAFARLRTSAPEATLLVVGDGPERARLEREAGPGVLLLGGSEDVESILAALDVFVLSSLNEGISNTILEAMATGTAIVVTDVGGNPELVEHDRSGTLVPAGDAEALAAALRRYREQPGLARGHGAAARERAIDRFSIPAMVSAYEAVWWRTSSPGREAR